MSEQESLQKQLDKARRRLAIREEQLAAKGRLNADPEIIIDIEETQEMIADLQKRILQVNLTPPPAPTSFTNYQPPLVLPNNSPVETEQEKLLREIDDPRTTHQRRFEIGDRLNEIGDTRPGVGLRADGLPDIVWLPVAPGGKITIDGETFSVPPFYIAKYLITYVQYEAFVKATDGFTNSEWWRGMPTEYQPQKLKEQTFKGNNQPRDTISWYQSVAFARWLNRQLKGLQLPTLWNPPGTSLIVGQNAQVRLPLEWEWQWAAQGGKEQREYPWGKWQEGYANTWESGLNRTTAVGLYPEGAAECGALDMTGNLFEWCANDYRPLKTVVVGNDQFKVTRGGAFVYYFDVAFCVCRGFHGYANNTNFFDGLRLVISTPIEGF